MPLRQCCIRASRGSAGISGFHGSKKVSQILEASCNRASKTALLPDLLTGICQWLHKAGTQLGLILLQKEAGSYGSTQSLCCPEMRFEELLFLACVGAAMYLGHGREEQQRCFAPNPRAAL
ncbi:uncharacterized [Tachysurus ichikawai]